MIESHGITIIRTNPDAADFDMNKLINQINVHISQSNKEKLEKEKNVEIKKLKKKIKKQENKIKEQKSKFAKELLSYISSISMPVKHIKYFVKKNASHIVKYEKHTIKNKPNKSWKRLGTMYCFACKDFTHNSRSQEVKMTNKVLREKPHCIVCRSNKSRFLKQKTNDVIKTRWRFIAWSVEKILNKK